MSLNQIKPELRHMVDEVIDAPDGVGVWLKRPYVFYVTGASTTFFDYEMCAADGLDPWAALNECIADEAEKIDPTEWDNR
jgi:uncharacterized protein YigE (DUF2233 family)